MRESRSSDGVSVGKPPLVLLSSLLATLLVAAAFGLIAARVVALEMHTHPPIWVVNAIPAALSELHFGHSKRYTILTSVQERYVDRLPDEFISAKSINPAIRKVTDMDRAKAGDSYRLLGPDDKGIVDLIELGFRLYGYRAESVTTAYFTILLASCLVYVAAFWRSPLRLLLLAAFLAMVYLVLPMVAYNAQLQSVLALRAMPVLSMVACLHALLFMAGSLHRRVSVVQIVLVAAQIATIAFTIHLRSTTIWQIATIIGFGLVMLAAIMLGRKRLPAGVARSAGLAVGSALGLAVAGYLAVQVYQAVGLPEEYRRGDELATRVFWHNVFSGLAYHPEFAERYQLRIDDSSIFAAARDYLFETGREAAWTDMGGDVPGFAGIKFAKYDPVVREMLLDRCSTYLRECLETVVYYKPVALAGYLAWLYGLRDLPPHLEVVTSRNFGEAGEQVMRQIFVATSKMDQQGQRAYLWTPVVLLVILPFVALLTLEPRSSMLPALAALAGLGGGSLIPIVIGYPVAHTILEPAIAFGMVVYAGGCVILARGLMRLLAARRDRQRSVQSSPPMPTTAN